MRRLPPELVARIERLCHIHMIKDVAVIVGVSPQVISKLKAQGWRPGHNGRPMRPRPTDFAIMQDRMTVDELAKNYRAGRKVIARWIAELGTRNYVAKPHDYVPQRLPAPDNLPDLLAQHGVIETARVLGVARSTLARMRQDRGLPFQRYKRSPKQQRRVGWADTYFREQRQA